MMENEEELVLIEDVTDSTLTSKNARDQNNFDEAILAWSNVRVECRRQSSVWHRFQQGKYEKGRVLLDNLFGNVRPGQIVAIMGASGVGKTTLLKVLSGQDDPQRTLSSSDVSLNGCMLTRLERLSGSLIGLVEQNETFVETMSLMEHLIFQAMLRMPQSMTDDERLARVRIILTDLSLDQCTNTVIRHLSGGERKRLAFATALLTNPCVLLFDEPTSGLDSYLAKVVMQMIRRIAVDFHRSIVVVLHQPTSDLFPLLDSLCLIVHGGRQAFFGTIDEAPTFFFGCGLLASSLEEYIEQLAAPPGKSQMLHEGTMVAECYAQSTHAHALMNEIFTLVDQRKDKTLDKNTTRNQKLDLCYSSFERQLKWLLWRSLLSGSRDPIRTTNVFVRTLLPSILFAILYFHLPLSIHYQKNVNALCIVILTVTTNTCAIVVLGTMPTDIHMFIKETNRSMYGIAAYYLASLLRDMPLFVLVPLILSSFVYLLSGINDGIYHYLSFVGIVILTSNIGAAFGFLFSSFSLTVENAISTAIPILQLFLMFSGFFLSLADIPVIFRVIQYISPLYFGYSSLYQLQWDSIGYSRNPLCHFYIEKNHSITELYESGCYRNESEQQHLIRHHISFNVSMLMFLFGVLHAAAFSIIWRRAYKDRQFNARAPVRRRPKITQVL